MPAAPQLREIPMAVGHSVRRFRPCRGFGREEGGMAVGVGAFPESHESYERGDPPPRPSLERDPQQRLPSVGSVPRECSE